MKSTNQTIETSTTTMTKEELKEAKKTSLDRLNAFLIDHPELKADFEMVTKRSPRSSNGGLKKSSDNLITLIKTLKMEPMRDIDIFKNFKFGKKEMLDISRMILIRYNKFITFENDTYTYHDEKPEGFKITTTKNEVELYDQTQIM